jgi:hypothetical protein
LRGAFARERDAFAIEGDVRDEEPASDAPSKRLLITVLPVQIPTLAHQKHKQTQCIVLGVYSWPRIQYGGRGHAGDTPAVYLAGLQE